MAPTEILARQHFETLAGPLASHGRQGDPADRPRQGRRPRREAGGAGGRLGGGRGRHPRPLPGRRRLPRPRPDGDRRAAPVRRQRADAAAGQGRGRASDRHVGDADPAHPGADGVRRPRRLAHRREAARPHAGRHPRRADAAGRRDRRAAADRGRRRRPGVLDLPAGLGVRDRRPRRRRGPRRGAAAGVRRPASAWSTASCQAPRRTR